MNIENEEEVRAHLDAVLHLRSSAVRAASGGTDCILASPLTVQRAIFRPTLFVAAVRAALGRATVLHGVAEMPPKRGVTEEGVLAAPGCASRSAADATAARCIEDSTVGFAYVSQRAYAPRAYALRHLRAHI